VVQGRLGGESELARELQVRRIANRDSAGKNRYRQVPLLLLRNLPEEGGTRLAARRQPLIVDLVAIEEPPDLMRPLGVALADDLDARRVAVTCALPALEKVGDDRQQVPLAVKWLDQEMVEQADIDGIRGGLEVVVLAEEDGPHLWVELSCLPEQIQTSHFGSFLISDRERHGRLTLLEVAEAVDPLRGAIEARGLIAPRAESAVELALQGPGHSQVASHSEEKRPHLA
jgi:hypothetical protein